MGIVHIHGVKVRRDEPDYARGVALRHEHLQSRVVPAFAERGWPEPHIADVYWGDLGATFAWALASVPSSGLEAFGAGDGTSHVPGLAFLAAGPAPELDAPGEIGEPQVESLGAGSPADALEARVMEDPQGFLRTLAAAAHTGPAPLDPEEAAAEGRWLARLSLVVEELVADEDLLERLRAAGDFDVASDLAAEALREALETHYGDAGPVQPGVVEAFGPGEWLDWLGDRVRDGARSLRDAAAHVLNMTARGASLLALQAARDAVTPSAFLFFGDVFTYLHRGRRAGDIADRVEEGLRAAAGHAAEGEPLVVITHSFGSMVLYDLLASGRLADVPIDLWVSAGAQVAVFAEMRLYEGSPPDVPSDASATLGPVPGVRRWVNVYDGADVLSYLAEPVFGPEAVTDISFREDAHLGNAHGDYFQEPAFYRLVARELRALAPGAP